MARAVQRRRGVVPRIKSLLPTLKGTLRDVAEYILQNPSSVIGLSTGEIAALTGTSEAAAVRLAQRLGYRGFRELQINMAYDLGDKTPKVQQEIEAGDDVATLAEKTHSALVEALTDSYRMLDVSALELAVEAMAGARRLILLGQGANTAQVVDLNYNLTKLGLSVIVYVDPYMQTAAASLCEPGDVVLGISHTGANRDLVEAFLIAKGYGAKTICLTMHPGTPLSRVADITLTAAPKEIVFKGEPFTSRISLMYLVDLLFIGVGLRRREAKRNLQRVQEALAAKRYPFDGAAGDGDSPQN